MKATSALSPGDDAAVNAGLRLITSELAKASLDTLARAIQKEESQVSRIRSEEVGAKISDVVRLIYTVGLKVVPADHVTVKRETYEAVATIAMKAMADPQLARRLMLDE